ncbi:MAG: hypothetical protein HYS60_02035 [Candidatus Wildermuthbacteria bacterium]|nr:hypothetical protein [Candidatus Wildermuthbacteria bacterium]
MGSGTGVIEGNPEALLAFLKKLSIPVADFRFQGENSMGEACKIAAVHSPHNLVEGKLYCLGVSGDIREEILFIVVVERNRSPGLAKGFSFRMPCNVSQKSKDLLVGAGAGQGPG